MHLMYFTEQPMSAYDAKEGLKYGATALTFSNKHFDPVAGSRLYGEYLEQYVYAEEVGVDGIMLNEHHNAPFCMQAKCNVFASILAAMTKRVKIVLLGNPLPLADNPVRGITTIMGAINAEPVDDGTEHFGASNLEFTSVDVGNKTVNVIPAEARARFNIRFNDHHTQDSLRTLVERRLTQAAGNRVRARIVWEPSNSNVFVTKPGAFTDLAVAAIEEITGRRPELSTSGGTSDARFIASYCPVIEFGLVGQTMHQIDERTPVSDLEKLTRIYRGVLDRYFA